MAQLPEPIHSTLNLIYEMHEKKAAETERRSNGIGISTIGEKCERKLWYGFHWVNPIQKFEGRILRLFETGKREEERIVKELKDAGLEVFDLDPSTNDQIRVEQYGGHLSGYLDGVLRGLKESSKWHVLEIKTHNDKNFTALKKSGVQKAMPKHYAQMQMGMHLIEPKLERALYIAHNKNTDELYFERIDLNTLFIAENIAKAERIIFAPEPLPKISSSAEAWDCKFCDFKNFCHQEKLEIHPEMNCRTCLHSTVKPDGSWLCEEHKKTLSKEEQAEGCKSHLFIPSLIPLEQSGVTPKGSVLYRGFDGTEFINEPGEKIYAVPF